MKQVILLISLFLFSISAYSATITVTNTNDSGAGSFRQAVADANMGDIIRFSPSLIAAGSDTIIFATPVNITKGLFIKGVFNNTDTLYFSGANLSRMIDINMASSSTFGNVDMDSLVFINGYSTEGGALKYTSDYNPNARLYVRHCVFRDNSSDKGGAIYSHKTSGATGSNYTCNITLEYSTFKNNMSSYSGAGNGGGGAVSIYRYSSTTGYAVGIDLVITGCNFLNNTAAARGGAIYAYVYAYAPPSTGVSNIDVTSSSFIGNEATHFGGALYSYSFGNTRCEAHSTTSTWAGNTTIGSGGACYLESVNKSTFFDASFSTFYGNTAFVDGSALHLKSIDTDNSYSSRIESYGSIFAANAGNVNYQNTIYQSASSTLNAPFSSSCYNLFDFPQNHLQYYQEYFPNASDDFSQTPAQINLAPVALNPNGTYTMVPMAGSVAIGAGSDTGGDAQNRPVLGVRDIGAAESDICISVPVSQTASICIGSTYDFYGQNLTSAGTYNYTIVTPNQCDTIVTMTLTTTAPVVPTISISANPGNTIMTGTPVTITATVTNGGTTPSYQWYANGSPLGPNAASIISSTLTSGVQVMCIVTSNDVCANPTTAQSNIITFNVHSNNDEPCTAVTLATNTTCITSYFANHIATETTNVGAHSCATSTSNDIWFKFVAPASGTVNIFTYSGTLTDAVMSVYLGANCSSLFEVGCVDDDGTNQMPQGFVSGAIPGTMYYIRVSSYGTTAVGNFAICLVEENSQPISVDDVVSTAFNTPVTIAVLTNDSDMGGSLDLTSLTISNPSANGTAIVNANGTITFTPNTGFSGNTTFQYQICDNGIPALCSVATVTVTVGTDPSPIALDDVANTNYGVAVTINVLANDSGTANNLDPTTLTIVTQSPNGIAVANANGTITFTPNNGFSGNAMIEYQICDDGTPAICGNATLTITVGANFGPQANDDVASTTLNTPVTIEVLLNDFDQNNNLSVSSLSIQSQSLNGTAVANANGTITFTPTTGFSGTTTFIYQICDSGVPALCSTATVTVYVGAGLSPIALNDVGSTNYGVAVTINVLANDSGTDNNLDLTTLTIVTQSPNGIAVANTNGTITFTPNNGFSGNVTIVYQICDDGTPSICVSATLTITVGANFGPQANDDVVSTTINTPVTIEVLLNDFDDNNNISISSLSIQSQSVNGTAVANANGTITFTPSTGFSGVTTFIYQICDNGSPALCSTATVTVNVGNGLSPIAVNDIGNTNYGVAVTINVLANDSGTDNNLDLTSLTILTQSPNGIAVANTNGTITFTPNSGFSGNAPIVYQICDDGTPSICVNATVTITVGINGLNEESIYTSIFPNPATNYLTVKTNLNVKSLKIYSLEGKLLKEQEEFELIDIQDFSKGVYFIELNFENGKISRNQFVKE